VIAPSTTVGAVELTVADLDRSVAYYRDAIGLAVLVREDGRASLGAGRDEVVGLVELPGATSAPRATGLFHLALRVPDRAALARWLAHAAREQVPLSGLSDHFVSEAIYLSDPDGHGIEIYADRPREIWQGQVARMTTLALDVPGLLSELADPSRDQFEGLPAGTHMGHVHLQVASVPEAIAFYRDVLGFELMATYGEQAAFLSAGGYHHHVGVNTWNSLGASPPPAGSAALRRATIVLPDTVERDRVAARVESAGGEVEPLPDGILVRDPSANPLVLTA
jgi:catechol 2,3-dioxygenase